jgi:hypothetical protein
VTVAGTHRVAVDAARLDPDTPPSLDGVVDGDDHRSPRHEGDDEQKQEPAGDEPCRPAGGAQNTVVDGETPGLIQAHDA